ncbi:hypothetical protein AA309_20210 [Microvirga vignae]|uniref:Tail terminator n=1 Tax=Microvirga vignae TaxID=1225564 RepID=A0A0H1R9A5_9HYPH|nr:hypothetical protein [Microvirga vignae]KLK91421.1 hypothetical protein AA309_20210 [Microvirga vignae]
MADKREQILVRLVEIAEAIPGIKTVERNPGQLDETVLPAIVILDADETADDADPGGPRGRPPFAPRRVGMTPEIYLMALAPTPEPGESSSAKLGPLINGMRAQFVKAVLTDASLREIVGTNGDIRYEGCATALARGRSMEAEMGVSFTFSYMLKPSDL